MFLPPGEFYFCPQKKCLEAKPLHDEFEFRILTDVTFCACSDVYINSFVRDYFSWTDIFPPSCKRTCSGNAKADWFVGPPWV
jgi:hypothetical protein